MVVVKRVVSGGRTVGVKAPPLMAGGAQKARPVRSEPEAPAETEAGIATQDAVAWPTGRRG